MFYKSIFQGYLQFHNERSYGKVLEMFRYKIETIYKTDILIKDEEYFHEDQLTFLVPRVVIQLSKKNWRNTVDLIKYLSQFAVSGAVGAWMIESGKILQYAMIEPQGDKMAVQAYLKGKKLSDEEGSEKAALDALTATIDKYDKHAQAYERRGYINYKLGNIKDAIYDFSKCIKLDPSNANAYCGRAKIYIETNKLKDAVEDLKLGSAKSIALQPIYWTATRMRAETYYKLKQLDKAAFDLKLFTNRNFSPDNVNFKWKKFALLLYSKVLVELEEYGLALEALQKIGTLEGDQVNIPEDDYFAILGIAKKLAGKKGYISDLKTAINLGSSRAQTFLEEIS